MKFDDAVILPIGEPSAQSVEFYIGQHRVLKYLDAADLIRRNGRGADNCQLPGLPPVV